MGFPSRRCGRVVDGGSLENCWAATSRGFESLRLRKIYGSWSRKRPAVFGFPPAESLLSQGREAGNGPAGQRPDSCCPFFARTPPPRDSASGRRTRPSLGTKNRLSSRVRIPGFREFVVQVHSNPRNRCPIFKQDFWVV